MALLNGLESIRQSCCMSIWGRVQACHGMLLEVVGLAGIAQIGQFCLLPLPDGQKLYGEIISLQGHITKIMLEAAPLGVQSGLPVYLQPTNLIYPHESWIGQVINGFGQVLIDGEYQSLPRGDIAMNLRANPPKAANRRRLGTRMDMGVRIFNSFLPFCQGQRMGIFAGSGVGKSMLLGALTKSAQADVIVIGLIGERGREVNEFIHDILGPEGMKRAVVIAATSDESPLLKRRAAWLSVTIAEYFRNQGKQVLLMMDSLTRFAEAQREIGLLAGETPTLNAFPTSAFSELMALCERTGTGSTYGKQGDITALFTVLVQGGDMNEPVTDCVRGTLDGHIIMERDLAQRGLYPAIDVLQSTSRSLPHCASNKENALLQQGRHLLSDYRDIEPMVRLGAYQAGSKVESDRALSLYPALEGFLYNSTPCDLSNSFEELNQIITMS